MKKIKKCGSRSCKPLTLRERIDIESKYRYGMSITNIATEISRNKSTVSREIDGKPRTGIGKYDADIAHRKALKRIENRGNISILDTNKELLGYVLEKLKLGWSPEQISIRLPIDYPSNKGMRISHEAIYQYIYTQIQRGGNGNVKKGCEDLRIYLARRHKRRAKKGFRKAQRAERNASLPSIEDRPEVVSERLRIGDWEDDLIVSRASKPCVKSINERKSGVVFFGKTKDGTALSSDKVVFDKLSNIPRKYLKTLTRDRGSENKDYKTIKEKLNLPVYFAHSYCSWERGSNENNNGLFRRFFPKKTDFDIVSNEDILKVEYLINTRPRKRLGGYTPAEVFYQETGVALFP
jgi:transposase, IS30 family